ncbi:hypothetical protein [Enterobacter sp. RHBSTW-00175]|uniref:hypothetical protein n=1 Tax=Enterobacter sp. RHBSTW-00175 TaxID=2742639 RepID=UPI0015E9D1A6|nr:hypothetical protein [Enterobacter sp. RHBSTW-00175]QMR78469.1 hypothetical protein HV107_23935 [Enterobacter sp. RHBSTW-00175]
MMYCIEEIWNKTTETAAELVEDVMAGAASAGVPVAAVALAGETGVSAVGMTTGLAALGCGSMLAGVAVVGGLGVVSYLGVKYAFNALNKESE